MSSMHPLRSILIAAAAAIAAPAMAAPKALTARDMLLLNRISWGADAASIARMQELGPRRWLDAQLHPSADDQLPAQVQAEIDEMRISSTPFLQLMAETEAQRRAGALLKDNDQRNAALQDYKQTISILAVLGIKRSLLRDIYSRNQLKEQMTWFWSNHFNVFMRKRDIRAMVSDYDESAIRPHALGRFRDLLEATLRHPAMLRYLDNADNAAGRINENYAREIMELHTLGVGSGYTQKDVQELARILTGVGVNLDPGPPKLKPEQKALYIRDGLFEFNPSRHDFGDKVFLGHQIKGAGYQEVEQALDILAREPATARHVSLQLAQYFVGDTPSPALVERMARTFQRTDGDIPSVLKTMFDSREFDASLGTQFKDPIHFMVSAVRVTYGDRTIINPGVLDKWLNGMAEGLHNHDTPDGYPLISAAWNGPGQMAVRFDMAHRIAVNAKPLFQPPHADNFEPAPLQPHVALYKASLTQPLGPQTREALGETTTPQDWSVLYLSSPEFMRR
jgi:uncharacterized protein (DUF1800 family)